MNTVSSARPVIDVHSHYVSPRALATAQDDPDPYGVMLKGPPGGPLALLTPGQPPVRPALGPPLTDLPGRLMDLSRLGVTQQVVGPWIDVAAYSATGEQGGRWSRVLNESLAADLVELAAGQRLVGSATLPIQDGARAAEELEYAVAELHFVGAMIGTNAAGRNLDDPDLAPLWAAADRLRTPIVLHPANVLAADRLMTYQFPTLLGYPFETTVAASALIFGGVLDRYPNLTPVLCHGGGALPYQIGRLTHGYHARPEIRMHDPAPPLDYLRRFYYDTLLFHQPALHYLIETVGADRVVLATDLPFDMGDPDPVGFVQHAGLSEPDVRAILGMNASGCYRL